MTATRQNAINDALERLDHLGFTMENSFSEHGPMVAEAISTFARSGLDALVMDRVTLYKDHV